MTTNRMGWKYSVCALGVSLLLGCGADSESGKTNTTGGTGGAGGSGAASTAGSGGTGGAGGSTGGTGGVTQGGQGGAPPSCDTAPCQGISALGQTLPTCCMSATACGVDLGGNCLDPAVVNQFNADAGSFNFGEPEVIVTDPACQGTTFDLMGTAIELDGCCDASGVCGVSTAGFPSFGGFSIPPMCVTNADAAGFGQGGGFDAGAEVPCSYPTDGDGGSPSGGETDGAAPSGGEPDASTPADGGDTDAN